MSRSGIEELFRAPDTQFIRVGADLREYDIEMAKLKGRLEASREGYNELYKIARAQKERADGFQLSNRLRMDTMRELMTMGRFTKEEANQIREKLEKRLSPEERALIGR